MEKIVLIDGNNIICRAYFGLPHMTTSKGQHTNGILGFIHILLKILDEEKPDYLAIAFDLPEPSFRHKAFSDYKAQRGPMDEALTSQFPVLERLLRAMNLNILEVPGFEADDLIGTVARLAEERDMQASVISGDKDLIQLAGKNIKIRVPITAKGKTTVKEFTDKEFEEEFGLPDPAQIIDLKALMGDNSDNYKGVTGVGPKTATNLLQKYGSLDGIYEHIDEVKGKTHDMLVQDKENAYFCKWLATIKTDCEIDFSFDTAKVPDIFTKEAYNLCKELELKSVLKRFPENSMQEYALMDFVPVTDDNPFTTDGENAAESAAEDSKGVSLNGSLCVVHDKLEFDKYMDRIGESEEKNVGFSFTKHLEANGYSFEIGAAGFSCGNICFVYSPDSFDREHIVDKIFFLVQKKGKNLVCVDIHDIAEIFEPVREHIIDLSIGAYLVYSGKNSYTCSDIARDFLGLSVAEEKEALGKKSISEAWIEIDFLGQEREKALQLLNNYAQIAFSAAPKVLSKLEENTLTKLFFDIEMPLVFALRDMELKGIRLDREALEIYRKNLVSEIKSLEQSIYRACGGEFNINSPKQLGEILFEKLKLPGGKKTKTGYSTAADVLEKLKAEDPVVAMILSYRELSKLKSTYAEGLPEFICSDGRIHTKFNQTVTATGRLSSSDPNLQNIPIRKELGREIRKMFIPGEGKCFIDADYSQIELRLLAHMSGDEKLIEAYGNGKDIHALTAAGVFGVPIEEVTPAMRSSAKAVNFGIIYGMSSFGLGQEINVSRKEAESYIEKYFETYPTIKAYLDSLVKYAREKGYATTMYNRKRDIPDIKASNFMVRQGAERIAMNSPIQGTAADIMKMALVNVYYGLKKMNVKANILLQVHDELLIEVAREDLDRVKEYVKSEMANAAKLSVNLEVSVGAGDNWDDAH